MKKSRNSAAPTSVRPMPPPEFADPLNNRYAPAPEVLKWARAAILTEGGALYNEDHAHLEYADVKFMWAPTGFVKAARAQQPA